ncbi:hypothetical protein Tsubulata_028605 [Turnera subulata]|uniref:Uncharacterized protein n=1 Tax=Turnera subulata TaxID=218843 RepID=A0A9Q0JGX3_9ROSI|nr:hypothetical protein Tsubulata_028605 [Turnera subulata]
MPFVIKNGFNNAYAFLLLLPGSLELINRRIGAARRSCSPAKRLQRVGNSILWRKIGFLAEESMDSSRVRDLAAICLTGNRCRNGSPC